MNDESQQHGPHEASEAVLEMAIAAMQRVPVPAGPPAELSAATIARLSSEEQPPRPRLSATGRRRRFTVAALGLAASVVVLLTVGLNLRSTASGNAAFAQALNRVRDGRDMAFRQEMTVKGKKRPIVTQNFIAEDGAAHRTSIYEQQIRHDLRCFRTDSALAQRIDQDSIRQRRPTATGRRDVEAVSVVDAEPQSTRRQTRRETGHQDPGWQTRNGLCRQAG